MEAIEAANFKHINIYRLPRPKNRKTYVYSIKNNTNTTKLGIIKWRFHYSQYCFFPNAGTIWNRKSLNDIAKFIAGLKQYE